MADKGKIKKVTFEEYEQEKHPGRASEPGQEWEVPDQPTQKWRMPAQCEQQAEGAKQYEECRPRASPWPSYAREGEQHRHYAHIPAQFPIIAAAEVAVVCQ